MHSTNLKLMYWVTVFLYIYFLKSFMLFWYELKVKIVIQIKKKKYIDVSQW